MKFKSSVLALIAVVGTLSFCSNAETHYSPRDLGRPILAPRGLTGPGRVGGAGKGEKGGGKGGKDGEGSGVPDVPGSSSGAGGQSTTGGRVIGGVGGGAANEPQTIEQLGLTRVKTDDRFPPDFLEDYIPNKMVQFEAGTVKNAEGTSVCDYLYSYENNAYVTKWANTENIDMKYRNMIVDNIRFHKDGNPATLNIIGTESIVQADAKAAITSAYQALGKDPAKGDTIVVTPDGPGWTELSTNNAFVQGQMKLMAERPADMGNGRITSFTVDSEVFPGSPGSNGGSPTPTTWSFGMITKIER